MEAPLLKPIIDHVTLPFNDLSGNRLGTEQSLKHARFPPIADLRAQVPRLPNCASAFDPKETLAPSGCE